MELFSPALLKELGIVDWGYTQETRALSFNQYDEWISRGDHGQLHYLADERGAKRADLTLWDDNIQSALVFLFDYSSAFEKMQQWYSARPDEEQGRIASYVLAYEGQDYHHVLRGRLDQLSQQVERQLQVAPLRFCLDTHPVLERDLARRAGLGWIGKNSMHIHRQFGSTHLLGALFFSQHLSLVSKKEERDHCGSCTACIQACPTQAIDPKTRTLKADRCISTFTIELFKPAPIPEGLSQSGGDIFGCDICQEVCPWNNRQSTAISNDAASPVDNQLAQFFLTRKMSLVLKDLEQMSNGEFRRRFQGTPLERTGRIGLMKNIKAQLNQA